MGLELNQAKKECFNDWNMCYVCRRVMSKGDKQMEVGRKGSTDTLKFCMQCTGGILLDKAREINKRRVDEEGDHVLDT